MQSVTKKKRKSKLSEYSINYCTNYLKMKNFFAKVLSLVTKQPVMAVTRNARDDSGCWLVIGDEGRTPWVLRRQWS